VQCKSDFYEMKMGTYIIVQIMCKDMDVERMCIMVAYVPIITSKLSADFLNKVCPL
jgi:hypothetical protein